VARPGGTGWRDATSRPSIERRLRTAGLPPLDRPAWLEVDTGALAGNLAAIGEHVGPATQVWPVVKDDAYGHGLEVAARTFLAAGAAGVCVATLGEAQVLRTAGIDGPVLILYPVPEDELVAAAAAGFQVVVATSHGADALARAWAGSGAAARGVRIVVHLEVDTGFTRMGVHPERLDEALSELDAPGITIAGLWSHLATPEDPASADDQESRLSDASRVARRLGIGATHLAATGGLLTGRGTTGLLVRPGLIAYGVVPAGFETAGEGVALPAAVRPALRLVARPMRIQEVPVGTRVGYGGTWVAPRPSRIATLPVGYGDGYARAYTGGDVLVRGRRAPVVGVVSMDACTVDVTDVPGASLEDEVVLLGPQGEDAIHAQELARRRTTIPWEVLTGMARRLTRVYDAPVGLVGVRTLAGETLVRRA
jgi:alanine racemase